MPLQWLLVLFTHYPASMKCSGQLTYVLVPESRTGKDCIISLSIYIYIWVHVVVVPTFRPPLQMQLNRHPFVSARAAQTSGGGQTGAVEWQIFTPGQKERAARKKRKVTLLARSASRSRPGRKFSSRPPSAAAREQRGSFVCVTRRIASDIVARL